MDLRGKAWMIKTNANNLINCEYPYSHQISHIILNNDSINIDILDCVHSNYLNDREKHCITIILK